MKCPLDLAAETTDDLWETGSIGARGEEALEGEGK